METGRRRVAIDEIARIAQALGTPVAPPRATRPDMGDDVDPLSRRSLIGAGAVAAAAREVRGRPAALAGGKDPQPGRPSAHLALACAAGGEPERTAIEGMNAPATARATRSEVTLRKLRQLDRRLADCDAPAAADFRPRGTPRP